MIDALTLTRDNHEVIQRLDSSLVRQTAHKDGLVSWFVMDNGGVGREIEDWGCYLKAIAHITISRNTLGFASGNNYLARLGKSPYILMLNDDIVIQNPDVLTTMLTVMENNANITILGTKLCFWDKQDRIQHAGVCFNQQGIPYHIGYMKPSDWAVANVARKLQAVTFALALVRRETYEALGGLDEQFYYNYEDVDFCLRAEGDIVYYPMEGIYHVGGASLTRFGNEVGPASKSLLKFRKKRLPFTADAYRMETADGKNMAYGAIEIKT